MGAVAMASERAGSDLLIQVLSQRDVLTEEERQLIEALPKHRRSFVRGEEIVPAHSLPTESCLLVAGFAGREINLQNGGRQITAIQTPGDFVDLHGFLLKVMDHSVVALTDCTVEFVPHRSLGELIPNHPHLGRLLWLSTVIDASIQRCWTASLGRRNAIAQMAHLICELYVRLSVVGLAGESRMEIPLSQETLGDVLGLSGVHVNRTLQEMRRRELITWEGARVAIQDFDALRSVADFDGTYLHLERIPR